MPQSHSRSGCWSRRRLSSTNKNCFDYCRGRMSIRPLSLKENLPGLKTKEACRAPEGNRTPVSCLGSTSTNHCATSASAMDSTKHFPSCKSPKANLQHYRVYNRSLFLYSSFTYQSRYSRPPLSAQAPKRV